MVRVTKEGYGPTEQTLVVAGHQAHDLELPLAEPNPDLSGTYTLTIAAAESCGVGLGQMNIPQAYRVLTYTATVRQSGPTLYGTLSGGVFFNGGGRFNGRIERDRVVFYLPWSDGEPPSLSQQLAEGTTLVVWGTSETAASENRLAGGLSGSIAIYPGHFVPLANPIAQCSSTDHQFMLSH